MKRLLLLPLAAAVALPIFGVVAAIPEKDSVNRAAAYLQAQHAADGSYGAASFGQNADIIVAIRAAGFDPARDITAGKSAADYLKANAAGQAKPAAAGKAALAAKVAGLDPKNVGGTNLVANISAGYDTAKGTYASDDFSQSIAMLGLACTGNAVPSGAITALKATQVSDGGWGFAGASDPDTTALAIQALLASGVVKDDPAVAKAITWIKSNQLPDGGWGFAPDSNASSTAYVVQALIAAGQSVDGPQYIRAGASPASYLLSQQNADGSFKGYDVGIATSQALPALAGRTFCNAADSAITQVRQQPTPTATARPSATQPATSTAAPQPPRTGSGSDDGNPTVAWEFGAPCAIVAARARR
jgi:hypothetical protein